jgi:formate hydrogenlyase transcriptional activator
MSQSPTPDEVSIPEHIPDRSAELPDRDQAADPLHAALEWLPIALVIAGSDGVIVFANREAQRLSGYTSAELRGQTIEAVVPGGWHKPAASSAHNRRLQRPLRHPAGRELLARRKDGSEVPVDIALTAIRTAEGEVVLASLTDLSEWRALNEVVRRGLDERLAFEALVAEIGAEFIDLRPDDVDHRIEDALGRIVRTLDLDRSALFRLVEDSGDFVHTHQWTRPGWAPPPPRVSAREQFPWHFAQVGSGSIVSFSNVDDVPEAADRESLRRIGTRSSTTIPLNIGGRVWGALTFALVRETRAWSPEVINRFQVVALIFASAIARKQADEATQHAAEEHAAIRDRLREENAYLRRELSAVTGSLAVVGHSPTIRRALEQVRQAAPTDSTVLLEGETGTGKALLAARIHELSPRRAHPMMRVNCASLSAAWIERELYGSERGAYGASETRHMGRLELANGSTVFLDEIADLPLDAQASLVRVLEQKQIRPAGAATPVKVDIRFLAATRRNLKRAISEGTFRDDLYFHLNVFPIHVPPLRERTDDIPLLVWKFVDDFSEALGVHIDAIDQQSMDALQRYPWPGNARELRNVVERAMIVATSRRLRIPLPADSTPGPNETLAAMEKKHIASVLAACEGQIEGKRGAAARLGMTPRALRAMLTRLGIRH